MSGANRTDRDSVNKHSESSLRKRSAERASLVSGNHLHPFETALLVSLDDIELELRGHAHIPWADYHLNPRRLRGSDFLMRWSQGVWSEKRLTQAVNESEDFIAIPYGPSGTAPDDDPRAF